MAVRIEKDLLGECEVPADAYWGIHTLRAIENFPISGHSVSSVPEMVRGMVMVKKACALANKELRALPADIADAIVAGCDKMLDEGFAFDQFPLDLIQGGAGTSTNMCANEVVANVALELAGFEKGRYDLINPNDHVNKAQSTNDAYPTGLHVALLLLADEVVKAAEELSKAFHAKSKEFEGLLKMGRTQLQDAVPMTLEQEFEAFAVTIEEEAKHIAYAKTVLYEINLGATAIGTGLNAPDGFPEAAARHLAEISGYSFVPAAKLIEATSDNGPYMMLHAAVKVLAGKLSKICNDLRLLSSGPRAGLNEINLPEMQAGSSIMPAKVNPVIPEVVNQVCFRVIGNDITVTWAAEAGQLQLNVMEPVLADALFESMNWLRNACDTLRERCVTGITANPDVMRQDVLGSIGIVTYLNEVIGHEKGDIIGKECARTGKSVREVAVKLGYLTGEEVDEILTVENFLTPTYTGKLYDSHEKGLPEK